MIFQSVPAVVRAKGFVKTNTTYERVAERLTVYELGGVVHNALYLAILLQMSDSNACQTAIDFQSLDEDTLADEFEGRDLLNDTVEQRLVEGDSVLGLVLDLSLRPLLLLCGFSTAR